MPLIRLSHRQREAARRNGARSRGPKTPEGKARSAMNGFKHGRYAKLACVLRGENKGAFHDLLQSLIRRLQPVDEAELDRLAYSLQSLVDRSKLPQFRAARESQLTFQRQAVLNRLRQLRLGGPSPRLPRNPLNPNRLTPKFPPRPNPNRTRNLLFLLTLLHPPNPAKTPKPPSRRPPNL